MLLLDQGAVDCIVLILSFLEGLLSQIIYDYDIYFCCITFLMPVDVLVWGGLSECRYNVGDKAWI